MNGVSLSVIPLLIGILIFAVVAPLVCRRFGKVITGLVWLACLALAVVAEPYWQFSLEVFVFATSASLASALIIRRGRASVWQSIAGTVAMLGIGILIFLYQLESCQRGCL